MRKFKSGDKVKCNTSLYLGIKENEIVTVDKYIEGGHFYIEENIGAYDEEDFTLVILKQNPNTTYCFECGKLNIEEYQVMIYDDNMELDYVKCCSLNCANITREENSRHLKDMYDRIERQCIQRLK